MLLIAECRELTEKVADGLRKAVSARQAPWQAIGALHLALEFGMTDVARSYAKSFTKTEWVDAEFVS